MGKCISRNSAAIALGISEKDLTNSSYILNRGLPSEEKANNTNGIDDDDNDDDDDYVINNRNPNGKQFSHKLKAEQSGAAAASAESDKSSRLAAVDNHNISTNCIHHNDHYYYYHYHRNNDDNNDYNNGQINSIKSHQNDVPLKPQLNVDKQENCYINSKNNMDTNNNNAMLLMPITSRSHCPLALPCPKTTSMNEICNPNIYHKYYSNIPHYLVQFHHSSNHQEHQEQDLGQEFDYVVASRSSKLLSYSERLKQLSQSQQRFKKLFKFATMITSKMVSVSASSTAATPTIQMEQNYAASDDPQNSEYIRMDDILQRVEQGQIESKKISKKHDNNEIRETKGTAISFGFRKNLNTTPKKLKKFIKGMETRHLKKQDKCNNLCEDDKNRATSGPHKTETNFRMTTDSAVINNAAEILPKDDNGNSDVLDNVHFEKVTAAAYTTSRSRGTDAQESMEPNSNIISDRKGMAEHQTGQLATLPGVVSRFGYRGPVRPSSTDITHRWQNDIYDNIENNNNNNNNVPNNRGALVSNLKRRSKSAHAGRISSTSNDSESERNSSGDSGNGNGNGNGNRRGGTPFKSTQPKSITFNLKQNSTIEYDRKQFFDAPLSSPIARTCPSSQHIDYLIGAHNNHIIRPTPCLATAPATAYSKFTLQTMSLPKPEYAVPISIQATTPSTPGSSYASSPVMGLNSEARIKDDKRLMRAGYGNVYKVNQQHSSVIASAAQVNSLDTKAAKHMVNSSTRRTFCGSREISADSGIASLDTAFDSSNSSGTRSIASRHASPKRCRPRKLQMIMNDRGKFEVRDLDESLSSESSSIVEPLALPKLPSEGHTVPLPLSGLVRSNTVINRDAYEFRNGQSNEEQYEDKHKDASPNCTRAPSEEDSESIEEEKLHLDRSTTEKSIKERKFKDVNTGSSKTSSPGSSIILSWSNAGESLAVKDFSTLSLTTTTDDSNELDNRLQDEKELKEGKGIHLDLKAEDVQSNALSSQMECMGLPKTLEADEKEKAAEEKIVAENKFAEMALQGSAFLLDDETSPTDSLVSSTESEEAACKQKKHKINEEIQEKDIDEISPELDVASPISPGTPTHASHSLSLSDIGNLIDDEIADQPALLFNQESQNLKNTESLASCKIKSDTPTLMESYNSMRQSVHSQTRSRSALHEAMELSLRTPISLRKAVLERAESLDTLSPCESICSDDLIMDFDLTSSRDSIERSTSIRSRSGTSLNKIDDNELFNELDRKGGNVMKELSTLLHSHGSKKIEKNHCAHLPARATRLLNRTRIQQEPCSLNNDDSDNSLNIQLVNGRGNHNVNAFSSTASSTQSQPAASSLKRNQLYNNINHNHHTASQTRFQQRDVHRSSDDLTLYDKSFRNAMIQDVLQFKKQLIRLRRILQETETLNPFENDNSQLFASCGLDSKLLDDIDLASLTSSITDDPIQELADLRRQVVYLQSQVDERDRTIRVQRNLIDKLEADKSSKKPLNETAKEWVNMATQTERARPYSIGLEGLSRSKPEYISYTTLFPAACDELNSTSTGSSSNSSNNSNSTTTTTIIHQQPIWPMGQQVNGQELTGNQTRRHTIISTTLTNYNHQQQQQKHTIPRRASLATDEQKLPTASQQQQHQQHNNYNKNNININLIKNNNNNNNSNIPASMPYKPVKITLIGDPLKYWNKEEMALYSSHNNNNNVNNDTENQRKKLITNNFGYNNDIKWHQNNNAATIKNEHHQHKKLEQQQQYKSNHNNHDHHNDNYQQFYKSLPNHQQQEQKQQQQRQQHQQQHQCLKIHLKPTVTIV